MSLTLRARQPRRIDAPLVQLLGDRSQRPADDRSRGGLAGLNRTAAYADGVGPSGDYIVPRAPRALRPRRRRSSVTPT